MFATLRPQLLRFASQEAALAAVAAILASEAAATAQGLDPISEGEDDEEGEEEGEGEEGERARAAAAAAGEVQTAGGGGAGMHVAAAACELCAPAWLFLCRPCCAAACSWHPHARGGTVRAALCCAALQMRAAAPRAGVTATTRPTMTAVTTMTPLSRSTPA
jgi:hypothetical protein